MFQGDVTLFGLSVSVGSLPLRRVKLLDCFVRTPHHQAMK